MTAPVSDDALIAEAREKRCTFCGEMADRLAELLADQKLGHAAVAGVQKLHIDLAASLERERGLTRERDKLQSIGRMRDALLTELEWNWQGYCPSCGGWDVTKGQGNQQRVHTKDCCLRAAIAKGGAA